MHQPVPTTGVVIVSYNTARLLSECLQSLRDCRVSLRVVVVDNASSDHSAALVQAHFPEVHLLALDHNVGFAAANNLGLRWLGFGNAADTQAQPDLVLLLNPDTVVHPPAIETLAAFLQAHPRVGLVGPRLLNSDGSLQAAAFRFPTLSMSLLDVFPPGEVLPGRLYGTWWHGRYPQERQQQHEPFPIDHPLGACMLVRPAVLDEVGLLDERYFIYSEEIDWCWRIRQAGWAIWQVPQAHVTHIGGGATGQLRPRMLVELHRSRVQFFRQHYSAGFVRAHRLIICAGMLRLMLLAWRDYWRGRCGLAALRAYLWTYGSICRL